MPGRRVIVETDSHGYPVRIVRRHSHHHGEHHHHPHLPHMPHLHWDHHHHDRPDITNEELAAMRETERVLREANEVLHRENHHLKANLHAAESDLRHQRAMVVSLQANVRTLAVENGELRRSLEAYQGIDEQYKGRERSLRNKITRLENENVSLRERIRELAKEVKDAVDDRVKALTQEVATWGRRWDDLDRRYVRMRTNLDEYIHKNDDLRVENAALRRANMLLERRLHRHRLL